MSGHAVEMTASARTAILEQARFISLTKKQPRNAEQWLDSVWDAIDSLEHFPRRARLAAEDRFRSYEVRQLIVGEQILLFSIDEAQRRVWVIGLRGAAQRPRPQDLPSTLEELERDDE